ncbi:MAG: hypothetical protein HC911_15155 [Chloroflexaceae bacterium]|nr:hypothetical protein [Chloroflexaceae bacterium]
MGGTARCASVWVQVMLYRPERVSDALAPGKACYNRTQEQVAWAVGMRYDRKQCVQLPPARCRCGHAG